MLVLAEKRPELPQKSAEECLTRATSEVKYTEDVKACDSDWLLLLLRTRTKSASSRRSAGGHSSGEPKGTFP